MFLFRPYRNIFVWIALLIGVLSSLSYGFFYVLEQNYFLSEFTKKETKIIESPSEEITEILLESEDVEILESAQSENTESIVEVNEEIINNIENINISKNEYYSAKVVSFVSEVDLNDFLLTSTEDIKNGFYTILNYGYDKYTFYCDEQYLTCANDISIFVANKQLVSTINNYVHPFNSYNTGEITIHSYGNEYWADFSIERLYTDNQINVINEKVNNIISSNITSSMNLNTKILTIHDYIINNTNYDTVAAANLDSLINQSNAYGSLIEGSAICSGYADAMALFLERFGAENYKVSSPSHVWNLVYVNNEWNHLDLTWDDPVTNNGSSLLSHDFYLVSYKELMELDSSQHNFVINDYIEAR